MLIKIDNQGNQLWNKLLSPLEPPIKPRMESVNSVQETSDGGFIIAGCKSGYDKDPSGIAYAYRGEHENTYGVLIKTDSSGNEIWSKTFNMCDESHKQNNWTCIYSVRQTNDFGYILAGRTCDDNTWVIKTDSMGNVEWENLIWIFNGDVFNPSSILETNDGGYLIGGNANLHGIGMFKIGRNEDANITENNQIPLADKQEQQEINEKNKSEKTQSGIQEEKMTSEAPGFGGILALAALVSIFIFWKKR